MSSTFAVRIPRKLRDRMKRLDAEWSGEVRNFLEERVKAFELMKSIDEIQSRAGKRRVRVDSTSLIREDRKR